MSRHLLLFFAFVFGVAGLALILDGLRCRFGWHEWHEYDLRWPESRRPQQVRRTCQRCHLTEWRNPCANFWRPL